MNTLVGIQFGKSSWRIGLGALGCFLGAILFTGCAEETTAPEDSTDEVAAAPAVPSVRSMTFDLSAMQNSDGRPIAGVSTANAARWNWINAAIRVTAINLILGEVLREPLEVIALALSVDPEYIGGGVFRWRYVWSEGLEQITIDLTGEVKAEVVRWELRLSGRIEGQTYDNALWFSGETDEKSDSGFWIFSDLKTSPTDVARIDWDLNREDDRSLIFKNIETGHEDFGNQLAYRVRSGVVSMEIVEGSSSPRSIIEWNEATGVGSITVPDYNEGVKACWDENQDDADCAAVGAAS